MLKQNAWTHSKRSFVFPGGMEKMLGRHGVSLQMAVFDPAVGGEVYTLYMEQPGYAQALGRVAPFNLFTHNTVIRTPFGQVAFII